MRIIWALALLLPMIASAQESGGLWDGVYRFASEAADMAAGKQVYDTVKPDIVVQVHKHPMGADMFEIAAVNSSYPADLLQRQAARIGEIVGVEDRGLRVGRVGIARNLNMSSVKATFATNGIIDREKGLLKIGPIIQAFAGAPEPFTVHAILIMFNGEQATAGLLRSYAAPGFRVHAISNQDPPVIQYSVQLLTQDPKGLEVPDTAPTEQKPPTTSSRVQQTGVDWSLWIPLIAGAAAAAVLVYYLMLRTTARPRR